MAVLDFDCVFLVHALVSVAGIDQEHRSMNLVLVLGEDMPHAVEKNLTNDPNQVLDLGNEELAARCCWLLVGLRKQVSFLAQLAAVKDHT
jgi:hypothetical protein